MATSDRSTSVPAKMKSVYEAIVGLTDEFCRVHLDDDYRLLAQHMAAALSRKRPSPLGSGKPRSWACGIVYELGRINFLSDRSTKPFMTLAQVCAGFGVGESTGNAKARVIADALQTSQFDPKWTLPSMLDRNPLVWMVMVDGMVVDLRRAPHALQEFAYEAGLIPHIPRRREDDEGTGAAPGEPEREEP